jgi:hypothetical protein
LAAWQKGEADFPERLRAASQCVTMVVQVFNLAGFVCATTLSRPMLTPFERGLVAHLVADWLLQNTWMAMNKTSLLHPAAWVHAGIHTLCLGLALGPLAGLVLGGVHLLIDTRVPLNWWSRVFKNRGGPPLPDIVALGTDQSLHIATIAAWVAFA